MTLNLGPVIEYSWDAVGLVWLVLYAFTKRTVQRQPIGSRLLYLAVSIFAIWLMTGHDSWHGWIIFALLPRTAPVQIVAALLTVAGCAFAIWARLALGANWSGSAAVKADHELMTNGPYAVSRHPIYTGLLLAIFGSALFVGELRALLAFVLLLSALLVKMSQEERFMVQTFPAAYPAYRQRVKALIPGIW